MSEVVMFWTLVVAALVLSASRAAGWRAHGIIWALALLCAGAALIVWVLHVMGWYA
jgi:hypothetical protein